MIRFFSLLLLLTIHEKACAQTPRPFRVMFYNVENFFDVIDNPATDDDEFTPEGLRHWHYGRYYHNVYGCSYREIVLSRQMETHQ